MEDKDKHKLLITTGSDEWYTPQYIIDFVEKEISDNIYTDPCSNGITKIGLSNNYTINQNGLEKPWYGTAFVNPPYSKNKEFGDKAIQELENGNAEKLAYLCFSNTDTKWFSKLANHKFCYKIVFLTGRVNFEMFCPIEKKIVPAYVMKKNKKGKMVKQIQSSTKGSCILFFNSEYDEYNVYGEYEEYSFPKKVEFLDIRPKKEN